MAVPDATEVGKRLQRSREALALKAALRVRARARELARTPLPLQIARRARAPRPVSNLQAEILAARGALELHSTLRHAAAAAPAANAAVRNVAYSVAQRLAAGEPHSAAPPGAAGAEGEELVRRPARAPTASGALPAVCRGGLARPRPGPRPTRLPPRRQRRHGPRAQQAEPWPGAAPEDPRALAAALARWRRLLMGRLAAAQSLLPEVPLAAPPRSGAELQRLRAEGGRARRRDRRPARASRAPGRTRAGRRRALCGGTMGRVLPRPRACAAAVASPAGGALGTSVAGGPCRAGCLLLAIQVPSHDRRSQSPMRPRRAGARLLARSRSGGPPRGVGARRRSGGAVDARPSGRRGRRLQNAVRQLRSARGDLGPAVR
jgi:hypothetical protein